MLRKFALWVGLLLGSAIILYALFVGGTVAYIWYNNTYKTTIQIVEVPSQRKQFVLLTDLSGFDDRSWYVYRSDLGAPLTSAQREGHNTDGVLFWNYSEAGEHKNDPHLRLAGDRFLVFTRGGLDHSLYDLKTDQVLINETSSFGAAIAKPDIDGLSSPEDEMIVMDAWVKEHLHGPIQTLLKSSP